MRIVERNGYDIAPIDVTGADGEMTVLSYVWPDQSARLERLRGAIAVARNVPARLHRQTAADAVAGLTLADGSVDRAVAFDHLAVPVRRRTGRDPPRDRRAGRASRCPVAVRAPHPRAAPATGPARRSSFWCALAAGRVASCRSWANATRTDRR